METRSKGKRTLAKLKTEGNSTKNKKKKTQSDDLGMPSTSESPMIDVLNDDALLAIFSYLTAKDLIRMERVSKKWRKLSMMSWINVKKIDFSEDFSRGYRLEHLEKGLKRCGKYLAHLKLQTMVDYGDDGFPIRCVVAIINKYCENLTHLDIELGYYPDRKSLDQISTAVAGKLKSLRIEVDEGASFDETLANLLKKSVNLEELIISGDCTNGQALLYLTEKCKELSVIMCDNIDNGMFREVLERLPHLEKLDISDTSVFAETLSSISNQLVSLTVALFAFSFFFGNSYKYLSLENLRILELHGNPELNDRMFLNLVKRCPLLEKLSLYNCSEISSGTFLQLKKFKNLKILDVGNTNVKDNAITSLGLWLDKLEEFDCRSAEQVTNAALLKLIELSPKLKKIVVGPSGIFTKEFFASAKKHVEKRSDSLPLTIGLSFGAKNFYDKSYRAEGEIERLQLKAFTPGNCCTVEDARSWSSKKWNENLKVWSI